MLSSSNKFLRYFVIIIVLGVFIYAGYNYTLTHPSNQGLELGIAWSKDIRQTVYDLNLPNDINYTKLFGRGVGFTLPLNITEYSNKTNPETTTLQFKDKQSIRSWLDGLYAPNLLKNMLKAMLDMSKDDFNQPSIYPFYWGTNGLGQVRYRFTNTQDASNNYFKIEMGDAEYYMSQFQKAWELVIRYPFTATDYDITLTRYPKP